MNSTAHRQPGRPPLPSPAGMFVSFPVFSIDATGTVERRIAEQPRAAAMAAPAVRVSLAPATSPVIAAALLRRLASQIEASA